MSRVTFQDADGKGGEVEADLVLVATGRGPSVHNIGLESAGVPSIRAPAWTSTRTCAPTCRTSTPRATSRDVPARPHLFPRGRDRGRERARPRRQIDYAAVPRCIYTDPEVAAVGLTEAQARELHGDDVAIGKFPFSASARAQMYGEKAGWVKTIHEIALRRAARDRDRRPAGHRADQRRRGRHHAPRPRSRRWPTRLLRTRRWPRGSRRRHWSRWAGRSTCRRRVSPRSRRPRGSSPDDHPRVAVPDAHAQGRPGRRRGVSHRLLVRAGFVRQVGSGLYTYLPLGWRVMQRIASILREEMDTHRPWRCRCRC